MRCFTFPRVIFNEQISLFYAVDGGDWVKRMRVFETTTVFLILRKERTGVRWYSPPENRSTLRKYCCFPL
jgi:hypothetical protein